MIRSGPMYTLLKWLCELGLGIAIAAAPAHAQGADPNAILERTVQFYNAGNYDAALIEAQKLEATIKARDGPNSTDYAVALCILAGVYSKQGKYASAEPLYRRALAIKENALGATHPDLAQILNDLAVNYQSQGQYAEAEPLHQRALSIREKALGPTHADVGESLHNLALLYEQQGKYAEAERFYQRALTTLYQRALSTLEKAFKYADAELLFKRALAIREKLLGPSHPEVAETLAYMGDNYSLWGKPDLALTYVRKATAAILAHAAGEGSGADQTGPRGLMEQRSDYFVAHLTALAKAAQAGLAPQAELGAEAFEIGQWSTQSRAASAVQQMAARTVAGSGPLAALVRESQDLAARWREGNKSLIEALSNPQGQQNHASVDALRKEPHRDRRTACRRLSAARQGLSRLCRSGKTAAA